MKRFWVFTSSEYEAGLGLQDLIGSYATMRAATRWAKTGEWGAVFDSKTRKQYSYTVSNEPNIDIIENFE